MQINTRKINRNLHENPGRRKIAKWVFPIKLLITLAYITFVLLYFIDRVIYFEIFIVNIITTVVILWLGPLRAIGGKYPIYDPNIIFQLSLFYYLFKGYGLAIGEKTIILASFSFRQITDSFIEISIILLICSIIIATLLNNKKSRTKQENFNFFVFSLGYGYYLLIVIGLLSLFLLLKTLNFNLLEFVLHPSRRGYMGTESSTSASGYFFFVYYGFQMLGIALFVKLAHFGYKKTKISTSWWFFSLIYVLLLFLFTPRATLLSYILSNLILYHLLIKRVKKRTLIILLVLASTYIYGTNLWRGIVGKTSNPTLGSAFSTLLEKSNFQVFTDKMLIGTDLSDVRIFVLIKNTYDQILPFKKGETFFRVFTQLIPRRFWPDKPVDLGVEIGQLFLPGTKSGTPPGFFPEMHMNFGVPGTFVGAILLGIGLSFLSRRVYNPSTPTQLLIIIFILPRIFLIVSSTLANLLIQFAFFIFGILLCFFMNKKVRPMTHTAVIPFSK